MPKDVEMSVLASLVRALEALSEDERKRVIRYLAERYPFPAPGA